VLQSSTGLQHWLQIESGSLQSSMLKGLFQKFHRAKFLLQVCSSFLYVPKSLTRLVLLYLASQVFATILAGKIAATGVKMEPVLRTSPQILDPVYFIHWGRTFLTRDLVLHSDATFDQMVLLHL
jgi:hypothetical protein